MSRKDYILIANVLKEYSEKQGKSIFTLACSFALTFKKENPRFDVNRFLEACNATEGVANVIA